MEKKSLLFLGVAIGMATPAMADIVSIAQKNGCFACHSINNKLTGPAWKEIAKRYKGDKSAEVKLIAKIKTGSAGVWGQIPMPPNPQVSDADIKTLVKGILALK